MLFLFIYIEIIENIKISVFLHLEHFHLDMNIFLMIIFNSLVHHFSFKKKIIILNPNIVKI